MSDTKIPGYHSVSRERSYDQRAKALIAFNTTEQAGKDRDEALQAAWEAMLDSAPPTTAAEPVARVFSMLALVQGETEKLHVELIRKVPAGTQLYATPQLDRVAELEAKIERLREALESIGSFQPKPASEDTPGLEEWNRAGEYAAGIAISALAAARGSS